MLDSLKGNEPFGQQLLKKKPDVMNKNAADEIPLILS